MEWLKILTSESRNFIGIIWTDVELEFLQNQRDEYTIISWIDCDNRDCHMREGNPYLLVCPAVHVSNRCKSCVLKAVNSLPVNRIQWGGKPCWKDWKNSCFQRMGWKWSISCLFFCIWSEIPFLPYVLTRYGLFIWYILSGIQKVRGWRYFIQY